MQGADRDALILSHAGWARRLALATVRRYRLRVDPDEAVSAAFLALVGLAGRYRRGPVTFTAFAHRRIIGAVRDEAYGKAQGFRKDDSSPRQYRADAVPFEDVAARLVDSSPDPYDAAVASERRQLAAELLAGVPARERQVLRMAYLEGQSLAEVGRALGVSESRACQIAHEGLQRIRDARRDPG